MEVAVKAAAGAQQQLWIKCSYCDWKSPTVRGQEAARALLKAHVLVCTGHPMREVETERDKLRAESDKKRRE